MIIHEDGVRALLAAQFPRFADAPVEFLHEGLDSRAFTVAGEWVFRFPKRAEIDARLATEIALLPPLALRLPLAAPRFQHLGRPSEAFPFRFVGYRLLPGEIGVHVEPSRLDVAAVGARLGAFLAALHTFPVEEAERRGVREEAWTRDLDGFAIEAVARLDEAAVRDALGSAACERAAAALRVPAAYAGPPRLLHGDLAGEHIILRPPDEIVGVIDWGDLTLGDPAIDLAGVLHLGGPAMLDAALDAYPHQTPGLVPRARFFALRRALEDVAYGASTSEPAYVEAGRRAIDFAVDGS